MKPYAITLTLWGVILLIVAADHDIRHFHIPQLIRLLLFLLIALGQIGSLFWGIIGFFSRKPKSDYFITFILGLLSLPTLLLVLIILFNENC